MKRRRTIAGGAILLMIAALGTLSILFVQRAPAPGDQGGPNPPLPAPTPNTALPAEPTYERIVREALDELSEGQVLFNPPAEMKVGETERVEVRLSRDLEADLTQALRGRGLPEQTRVTVAPFMAARLQGEPFTIVALSEESQVVGPSGYTEWAWDVEPKRSGTHALQLRMTVRVLAPGLPEQRKDLPLREQAIQVRVDAIRAIRDVASEHWQWLASTLLLPAIAVAWRWWRNRNTPVASRRKPKIVSRARSA